jgi:DNA polymerase IIIc chi subunit
VPLLVRFALRHAGKKMTSVDFYFNAEDKLQVACRLAGKALAQGRSLLVYAPEGDTASRLDKLLWTWPATGFVPHCPLHDPLAADTPVLIAADAATPERCDVLLNLSADCPPHFERFDPEAIIDIATLTGACVIALGHVATGLFANDDRLAEEIRLAADDAWDRVWRMPLWEDYQEQLRSNFADFANIGGRPGGSITAACFLARFTRKLRWAHLDVAGTAWRSGREKGSTGRPVPLLVRFALRHSGRK